MRAFRGQETGVKCSKARTRDIVVKILSYLDSPVLDNFMQNVLFFSKRDFILDVKGNGLSFQIILKYSSPRIF